MTLTEKLSQIKEHLEKAQSNIKLANILMSELSGDSASEKEYQDIAASLPRHSRTDENEGRIIEGVFDGIQMIGPDGETYQIPANYASKSKLVPGDILKLTIKPDGAFLYKQIKPIERKRIKGPLVQEEGQYKVIVDGKAYNVLLASVTYFKTEIGDEVTIIVPADEESEWGAIENVIPG